MHRIILAGFPHDTVVDELPAIWEDFEVSFSTTPEFIRSSLQTPANVVIVHESFYRKHQTELNDLFRNDKDLNIFMMKKDTRSKFLEKIEQVPFNGYVIREHPLTVSFLTGLIRISTDLSATSVYKDMSIDYRNKVVYLKKNLLSLTPMEYDLLIYMKFHEGIALSRDELIRAVWGYSFLGDSRTIDTHIKSLRRKLGPYRGLVKTVWGKGYKYLEG